MKRENCFKYLEAVTNEYGAAKFSVAHVQHEVMRDSGFLHSAENPLKPSFIRDCACHLEITYLLRLFAEFESVLRDYYAFARPSPRPRRTRMETLMLRIAGLCNIPEDPLKKADAVREYRNAVIHHRERKTLMTFNECKSCLARFMSFLPRNW